MLSFLLLSLVGQGQVVKNVDSRQGLPDNSVNSIVQDAQGFIWMGTANGLCRYDGVTFTTFRHRKGDPNSLINSNVHKLLAVPHGLYVTTDHGVDFYSFQTGQFSHCAPSDGSASGRINSLAEKDGQVFGAAESGKLYLLSEDSLTLIQNGVSVNAIASVDGKLFAIGNLEAYLLSGDGRKVLHRLKTAIQGSYNTYVGLSKVTGLLYVGNRLGTKSYAFKVVGEKIVSTNVPVPDDLCTLADYQGQLVFGLDGHGVTPLQVKLCGNSVYSMLTDKSGNLWVGTYRSGVSMVSHVPKSFTNLPMDLVTAVVTVKDDVYVGLDGGGVTVYHKESGQFRKYNAANSQLPGDHVIAMAADGENVWMAIYNEGLCRYHIPSGTFKTYQMPETGSAGDLIWTLCDDGKGHIWTGGRDVVVFDKQTETLTVIDDLKGVACQSLQCRGNDIWMGASNGVYRLDVKSRKIKARYTTESHPITLPDNGVKYVYADAYGMVWVSYRGFDACRIDLATETVTSFGARDGLAAQTITSIVDRGEGQLVLSTLDGIYGYLPKMELFVRLDSDDNVPTVYNFGACWQDGQTSYFGSTKGLVTYIPQGMADTQLYQKVSLTSLELTSGGIINFGEKCPGSITLSHDQNFFSIRYTVPEYQSPRSIRFSCYMKGLENDWRDMSDGRVVNYTSVPPGDYDFMVRCTDDNGLWTEPSVLHVTIMSPWYLRWWARLLWTLLGLAIISGAIWLYLHELDNKHKLELSEMEKASERKLNDAKMNFYTSITHELRTPVFLIAAQLEDMMEGAGDVVKVPGTYLATIHRNAIRLNNLISRVIDFRKMGAENLQLNQHKDDIVAFCHSLTESYKDMFRLKDIEYELEAPEREVLLDFDPLKMELIISNLISNAFKYTKKGGRVVMSVRDEPDRVVFSVRDNGIGIDGRVRDSIFERYFRSERGKKQSVGDGLGLSYVKSLVELHGGKISVESEIGKGSDFVFYIPKQEPATPVMESVPDEPVRVANPAATHTILIIDDERDTVELLERNFEKDFRVLKAYDGEEGLEKAAEELPDVILCDILMPKMDGFTFLNRLKQDKKLQQIKVIILSGETSEEEMVTASDVGADAYFTKPVSLKLLHHRIDKLIAQSEEAKVLQGGTSSPRTYTKEEQLFVLRCKEIIDDNLSNPSFNIEFMADTLAMSHSALYKKLKAVTGMSLIEFINDYKIYKAIQLFRQGETNVEKVAEACGVNDPKNFRTLFKRKMNMTPKQFVKSL